VLARLAQVPAPGEVFSVGCSPYISVHACQGLSCGGCTLVMHTGSIFKSSSDQEASVIWSRNHITFGADQPSSKVQFLDLR
jgi:hypothetical protein